MTDLPTGTVTFLFTDIEGSTRLWEQYPDAMRAALARHHVIVRDAIEACGGFVFKTVGDAFCAAFVRATDAVAAALSLQQRLLTEEWKTPTPLRVRVSLHTGEADVSEDEDDYYGATINRCHRLLTAAHAGQILLSHATSELVRDSLPEDVSLKDWGEHRLRDLTRPEHVFQVLHPDLPADFPPLRGLASFPNNLPVQATGFIGREKEIAEVKERLQTARLLTLTGVGGTGKTRLALQVGAELLDVYPDGVWFVELAALFDADFVPQTVAAALGVQEEANRPLLTTLLEYLRPRRLLLLLDNCEHLIRACAQLADAVLKACPRVQLLTTSREGLWIAGEVTYQVPTLPAPDPGQPSLITHLPSLTQYEAVRLFIDRAVAANPGFAVTNQNAPAVTQICYQLDGMPLAIELAAARVKVLPVEQITARLDDRFRLLTGGSRTALPRQQTLRALIDWSYDLLSEAEQTLFRRLAVFGGGWALEQAEQVCSDGLEESAAAVAPMDVRTNGRVSDTTLIRPFAHTPIRPDEVLDLLTQLVDKSLVLYEEHGGTARYRMLETVRQYSRDRLLESGEDEVVRRRHVQFFLRCVEEGRGEERQAEWLDWCAAEHINLRAALEWTQTDKSLVEWGLRLAAALWWFWLMRGHLSEGREHLAEILTQREASHPRALRARVLNGAGHLARSQGDYAAAHALLKECLEIRKELGNPYRIAQSLNNLGLVAKEQGDYEQARAYYEESLLLRKQVGDQPGIAASLNLLGLMASDQGDHERAHALHEESLSLRRRSGHKSDIAASLNNLGLVAWRQGDYAQARAFYKESLSLRRELGDKLSIANTLNNLGHVAQDEGDYQQARTYYEESLTLRRELGVKRSIADSLNNLGGLESEQGDYEQARAYYEESLLLRRELGDRKSIADSLSHLGVVAAEQGDYQRVRAFYEESLSLRQELNDSEGIAECLEKFAILACMQEQCERAARLFGAAESLWEASGMSLPPEDRVHLDEVRETLGDDAFAAAWSDGRKMTVEAALAYALDL